VQIVHSTFEETRLNNKFDLILFIHSIFTFKNPAYLKKAKTYLSPSGQILIASNQASSLLANLKKIVDLNYKIQRKEISSVIKDINNLGLKPKITLFTTKFSGILSGGKLT
jgi:hypothetical protein